MSLWRVLVIVTAAGCGSSKSTPCEEGFSRDGSGHCVLEESGDTGLAVDDTGTPTVHPRMDLGPLQPCSDPADSVSYSDVSVAWGIAEPAFVVDEHSEAAATAVADFDADGDLDIIFFFREEAPVLHTRVSEGFEQTHLDASTGVTQIGMADLDGDGRLDLLLGGFAPEVLLNTTSGWQTMPFPVSSFVDETSVTKSIHPMDIDRDGIQDAYVLMNAFETSGTAGMDVLAFGVGDGSFVLDETQVPTAWGYQKGFDAQWFDWDDDGWQDVYVANEHELGGTGDSDRNQANFFLRNNLGVLELANEACQCDFSVDSMGVGLGDPNRDGLPDLYVTATSKNLLLQQLPDASYADVGQSTGADTLDGTIRSMAWGGVMVDFDNDGLEDIAVAEGDLWHEFSTDPVVLDMPFNVRRQVELGRFEDANVHGFGQMGSWRSIVAADHNSDGVLDFVVSDVEKRPMLLLSEGCTANNWIDVAAPHGSRVEVEVGGETRMGWANTASGFGAVVEPVVHFGLGAHTAVDAIRVVLPDGSDVSQDSRVAGRRRVTIR